MTGDVIVQIENIFHPRSMAVAGVSNKSSRLGNLLLYSFTDMGFKGDLYPVNPREDQVMRLRCYPSLREIEGPVDLVIISVHPRGVPDLIEDCIAKGVKAAVIFSPGFREIKRGYHLLKDLRRRAPLSGLKWFCPCLFIVWPVPIRASGDCA
jgi:acyl-CoA synthetase (NDP forming)